MRDVVRFEVKQQVVWWPHGADKPVSDEHEIALKQETLRLTQRVAGLSSWPEASGQHNVSLEIDGIIYHGVHYIHFSTEYIDILVDTLFGEKR